ncbi:MAG: diguanylate cyclase [Phycisphaeraceae bacterium]|nr:diguanylate cyclase [Phycisphaeraceae bacterium]
MILPRFIRSGLGGASARSASCERRRALLFERLDQVQIDALPLLTLMRCSADDAEAVTAAIQSCPALAGRLLSVINSAAFALPRPIDNVRRAVLQLGAARARSVALAFALRHGNDGLDLPRPLSYHLWVTALRKASAARLACQVVRPIDADLAFCHGLLQDIALPMMIHCDRAFYEKLLRITPERSWCQQEREHFGVDHATLGRQLLSNWSVPDSVCQSVLHHHNPPLHGDDHALLLRLCVFLAALIGHFDESPTPAERDWMIALHGQFLSQHYASPDKFLAAARHEAQKLHGSTQPPPVDAAVVRDLTRAVADNTVALVGQLSELENSLGQAQKRTNELRFAAFTDPLTRLLNRRGFFELGQRRLHNPPGGEEGLLVLAIDLDGFKYVNDSHGHDAGDRLLCAFAHRLRDSLDRQDLVARIGGDEFVALVCGVDESRARVITQRLHERCNGATLELGDGRSIELWFSCGAVFRDSARGGSLDELLNAADAAMYERKRDGKHGFHFVNGQRTRPVD